MSQSYEYPEHVKAFLKNLRKLEEKNDRGALSALRRGASDATQHLAWPVIRRCGGSVVKNTAAWTSVSAAYAFYPQPMQDPAKHLNFGGTCSYLAEPTRRRDNDGRVVSSFDSRFRRVLASSSTADLAKWVIQIVKRAKTAQVPAPINYEELLTALLYWDSSKEQTRRRWAEAYWPGNVFNGEDTQL